MTKPQHMYSSRDEIQKELKDLTKLLDALKGQIIQLKNQLHSMQNKFAKKTLIRLIKQLEGEIACIEKQIADLVKGHPELNNKVKLITSIKGVYGNMILVFLLIFKKVILSMLGKKHIRKNILMKLNI